VLSLDDPVAKWELSVPDAERITVRMLLENTSGLAEPSIQFRGVQSVGGRLSSGSGRV
jgi:CubicO group peptidase (beta-lactamase class C family)